MKCSTWSKDCNELFDYENKHIISKNLSVVRGGYLLRLNEEITIETELSTNNKYKQLLQIRNKNGQYYIATEYLSINQNNLPFISLRHTEFTNNKLVL